MSTPAGGHDEPFLSETQRGVRAALLGAMFGLVLALLGGRS